MSLGSQAHVSAQPLQAPAALLSCDGASAAQHDAGAGLQASHVPRQSFPLLSDRAGDTAVAVPTVATDQGSPMHSQRLNDVEVCVI